VASRDGFDVMTKQRGNDLMNKRLIAALACTAVTAAGLVLPATASLAAPLPAVSVAGGAVIARPTSTKLAFVVSLTTRSTATVTANYTTVDGTALAGSDYTTASGVVTVPAGSLTATVNVTVSAVAFTAGGVDKSFGLDLSNLVGAQAGTLVTSGVIHPDAFLDTHSGTLQDAVVDPLSKTAYITNSSLNEVEVLNLKSGKYGTPIAVGSAPAGIDITPDGTTLYVCDSGAQAISVVDVATRKVTKTITTPAGFDSERSLSIAIASNGHALFTTTFYGSGFGAHVYDLNLSTGAITVFTPGGISGQATEDTPLVRSSDHSTIVGVLGDDSGGPFFVYNATTGKTVSGGLNSFVQWAALSGNGSELLIDGGTSVVTTSSGALAGTISGTGSGIALNSAGTTGYRLESGAVGILNVSRFLETGSIPAPDATTNGMLLISPDSHTLVALTASGVTIVKV